LKININLEFFTKYIYSIQDDFVLPDWFWGRVKITNVFFTYSCR